MIFHVIQEHERALSYKLAIEVHSIAIDACTQHGQHILGLICCCIPMKHSHIAMVVCDYVCIAIEKQCLNNKTLGIVEKQCLNNKTLGIGMNRKQR